MSCSIANASGSVALRANMGSSCVHRECLLRFLQRSPNLQRSSTTRYVVYGQNLLQLQCIVKLRTGHNAAARVVFQREMLQFAAFLHAELHGLTDHFVRMTKGHATTDEICCAGQCVHEPARCGFLHTRIVESRARHESAGHRTMLETCCAASKTGCCVSCISLL